MKQKLYSVVCFQTRRRRHLSSRMDVQAALLLWHWPHARRVYRSDHKYPSNTHRDVTLLSVTADYTLFTGLSVAYQFMQSGSLQQRTDWQFFAPVCFIWVSDQNVRSHRITVWTCWILWFLYTGYFHISYSCWEVSDDGGNCGSFGLWINKDSRQVFMARAKILVCFNNCQGMKKNSESYTCKFD
jgi:hypothetical protein